MVAKEYDKKINDVIPYYPDFYMNKVLFYKSRTGNRDNETSGN